MDTEFVNVYIQKQKSLIDELIAKNILLETKLTLVDKVVNDLTNKTNLLEGQLKSASEAKKTKVTSQ